MVISFHDFLHTARLLKKRRRDFKKAKSRSPPKVSQGEFTSKGDVIVFSTARTTPSFVFTPFFVEPRESMETQLQTPPVFDYIMTSEV